MALNFPKSTIFWAMLVATITLTFLALCSQAPVGVHSNDDFKVPKCFDQNDLGLMACNKLFVTENQKNHSIITAQKSLASYKKCFKKVIQKQCPLAPEAENVTKWAFEKASLTFDLKGLEDCKGEKTSCADKDTSKAWFSIVIVLIMVGLILFTAAVFYFKNKKDVASTQVVELTSIKTIA